VEIDAQSETHAAGSAPYLDYRPATADELEALQPQLQTDWVATVGWKRQ